MKTVIFDTETTGLLKPAAPLEEQPQIIEIGMVVMRDNKFESAHNFLINPGKPLPPEITKITGLKDEDLADKPSFAELLPTILEIMGDSDFWIAHNMPFDYGMLMNELLRCGVKVPYPRESCICTVQEYAATFGRRPKLTELYKFVMNEELEQTHRALDDAQALYRLLEKDKFFELL